MKGVSQNGQTLNIIGIFSYCVLEWPVFEWNNVLLHPELTRWWSFLFANGAHHKKPHSPKWEQFQVLLLLLHHVVPLFASQFPSARDAVLVIRHLTPLISACLKLLKEFNHNKTYLQLEIVDQWSTRIPPPHRRGWQWAMGGLQLNIVQNHKAAILKAT